jgi:hypothetical protein
MRLRRFVALLRLRLRLPVARLVNQRLRGLRLLLTQEGNPQPNRHALFGKWRQV